MATGLPQYISVAQLAEGAGPYAWGIFDTYPSADLGRPPMLWGIAKDPAQLSIIANRYGLGRRLRLAQDDDVNADIINRSTCTRALIVVADGAFACWPRRLDWLYHRPPVSMLTGLGADELATLSARACQRHGVGRSTAAYLRNYLMAARARQAHRPRPGPATIELIYSSAGKRSPSQAHLIVETTRSHLIADLLPFHSGDFLLPGWAGYSLYTAKLSRAQLESDGQVKHKPTGRTFYRASQAHLFPRHADHRQQLDDDLEGEALDSPGHSLIELPATSLQWAIETLSLPSWPLSPDDLKRAYRRTLGQAHPDKGGSAELFMQARAAYAYLSSASN
ncbi:hypothetical protein D9M70_341650 [compost metagenome]